MASRLKNLAEDIFGDTLVETTDVQGSLIRLRSCTAEGASCGRQHAAFVRRGHGRRDRVVVLGNVEGGRHVRLVGAVLARGVGVGVGGLVVGHYDDCVYIVVLYGCCRDDTSFRSKENTTAEANADFWASYKSWRVGDRPVVG